MTKTISLLNPNINLLKHRNCNHEKIYLNERLRRKWTEYHFAPLTRFAARLRPAAFGYCTLWTQQAARNLLSEIKTATQYRYMSVHIINQCACVLAVAELEAEAIALINSEAHALNGQSEQIYIFSIECHSQICRFIFDPARLIQETFNVWQDLAGEATGCDTEWGYPVSINSIAEAFHIPSKVLAVLLANFTPPELELCLTRTALTFHFPPSEINQNAFDQNNDVVLFSESAPSQPLVLDETQLVYATPVTLG